MFRATSSRKSSYDDHPRSWGYKTETSDQEGFLELTSWQHQLCYLREVRHEEKHLNSYSLSFPNCDCPPFTETGHGSRSRLYRRQNLQVNTRWKALAEIYKMYMLLHRSDLTTPGNFRQTFPHFSANFGNFRQTFTKNRHFWRKFDAKFLTKICK